MVQLYKEGQPIIRLTDRSRNEVDSNCHYMRYLSTEFTDPNSPPGTAPGIVPNRVAFELLFGTAIHNALATLHLGVTPFDVVLRVLGNELHSAVLNAFPDNPQKRMEYLNLGQGMLCGYYLSVYPMIEAQYDVLAIEKEINLDLGGGVVFMLRPDIALQDRETGHVWAPDFKTTGFTSKNWADGWRFAPQLQMAIKGLELALGGPVEGAMIIGLYKGQDRYGSLRSPFTYYYSNPNSGAVSHSYVRGWEMLPVHDYPGGVQAYVLTLPPEVLLEQFPIIDKIPLNPTVYENYVAQVRLRETNIHQGEGKLLADLFPRNFKACRPLFGRACGYQEACYSPSVGQDPIGSGLYVPRTPHHKAEQLYYERSSHE